MSEDQTRLAKAVTDTAGAVNDSEKTLELFYRGEALSFHVSQLPIKLGRDDSQCAIVTQEQTASRIHCTISLHNHQLILTDTSTNGTYLQNGGAAPVFVNDSLYPLSDKGYLRMGEQIDLQSEELVHFRISKKTKNA
jgi:predicted component of type VI protein secretion system